MTVDIIDSDNIDNNVFCKGELGQGVGGYVLFLSNWIRSDIRNVGDIVFCKWHSYICVKLVCKENRCTEIMMVMAALKLV